MLGPMLEPTSTAPPPASFAASASALAVSASSIAFSIASRVSGSQSSRTQSFTLFPFLLTASTFTLFRNRYVTNLCDAFPTNARCSAFSLLYVIPLGFAPLATNALAASTFPLAHAKCNGVNPSPASALTLAPRAHNISIAPHAFECAARCNGVRRSASTASKSFGSSASARASASRFPARAASCATVVFGPTAPDPRDRFPIPHFPRSTPLERARGRLTRRRPESRPRARVEVDPEVDSDSEVDIDRRVVTRWRARRARVAREATWRQKKFLASTARRARSSTAWTSR